MAAAASSTPTKAMMDLPMLGAHDQAMAGAPPHHKGKGKHDMMPKVPMPGDIPGFPPGFLPGFMPGDMAAMGQLGGQLGKPVAAPKQELPPATTVAWQSVASTSSPGKLQPAHPDAPHSIPASSHPHGLPAATLAHVASAPSQPHGLPVAAAPGQPHGLPQPPHSLPDLLPGRGKKGEGPTTEAHQGPGGPPLPPHASHPQGMAGVRGGPGREETSPLAQISSMFPPGHPASVAELGRRTGVFAIPSSRDQGIPPQGLAPGMPLPRGGSHEPRYTSPKMLASPVNVITTGQPPATSVSLSSPAGLGKHPQHGMTSPPAMPPVPALVQAPHMQVSPKLPHGLPLGWPPASGPQPPIHTPPPPSPSQVSPTPAMQPQRPQSVQLPVAPAAMEPSPSPLALKRPPSAHSNQPPSQARDRPGRPPSHHGDLRPPSLPGDLLPPPEGKGGAGLERRDRELEQREREQREREQREREQQQFLHSHLANLQRQGFYMVQGEHGPMAIPHGMVPPLPHSQHDPAKLVGAGPPGAPPANVAVVTTSAGGGGRRGSLQESLPSKVPPATSASALYSGVVAGQPHSLSPKTASPVGQVRIFVSVCVHCAYIVCVYVCVCVCMRLCVCACVHVCVCAYVCIHVCE